MKVLILTTGTGGGHNSCARYIERELKDNNIPCMYKDFYDIVDVNFKNKASNLYLGSLKNDGKIFKTVYKLGEAYSKTGITSPVYLVNKLHNKKLYDFINSNHFDFVIATHLFPALTLTAINKSSNCPKKINFITIATDYEPCPFFEESDPNYFIIQKGLEDEFIAKGISSEKLLPFGIPIATSFVKKAKSIRDKLGIKTNETLILVMLGSMGFGRINDIILDILKIKYVKVAIVCGNNSELYDNLKQLNNKNLILFKYINNMNDLIKSSDIVMSKPGGLSSTEIATFGKPLLHIFPIPGIENYNTNFFKERGMSLVCNTKDEIISNIKKLLNDKALQEQMIKNQHKYINENSAKDLIEFIIKKYDVKK